MKQKLLQRSFAVFDPLISMAVYGELTCLIMRQKESVSKSFKRSKSKSWHEALMSQSSMKRVQAQ